MKAQIHTSPVAQAFLSHDECPFCKLEKDATQRAIRFFAGPSASYMEPGVRGITNRLGFCGNHMKSLYEYGNTLGNALMLQSHMEDILLELDALSNRNDSPKRGLFKKKDAENRSWEKLQQRVHTCAICDQVQESVTRHYKVFFSLLEEAEFREYVERCNGFCLPHFAQLLREAQVHLPNKYADWFYPTIQRVMKENMVRVEQDLSLLIKKYDYRNADLDWGNAKDSVPRSMQKLSGIYPADSPYRKE